MEKIKEVLIGLFGEIREFFGEWVWPAMVIAYTLIKWLTVVVLLACFACGAGYERVISLWPSWQDTVCIWLGLNILIMLAASPRMNRNPEYLIWWKRQAYCWNPLMIVPCLVSKRLRDRILASGKSK